MKIARIETALYRVPPKTVRFDSIQEFSAFEMIVARIRTEEGLEGTGFSYTIGHGGRSVFSLLHDEFAPWLEGQTFSSPEKIWDDLWWKFNSIRRGAIGTLAVAPVDLALWDLSAQAERKPLFRLLGGDRTRIPTYNTEIGWLQLSAKELAEQAAEAIAKGFQGVKIKVGKPTLAEDVSRLEAVRRAIGDSPRIMVDANLCWGLEEATRRAQALEPLNIYWLEEPLEAFDVAGHARLQAATKIPLAVGETLNHRRAFEDYARAGAARILQPDVARVGGPSEWMRIAHIAAEHGLSIVPHFLPEIHLQLVAAIPHGLFIEYLPQLDAILVDPPRLENGEYHLPETPGHGLQFDWEKLEAYRIC